MSYRLLALPDSQTMTPALLRKIAELVEAGATVVGSPPQKSPGLSGYPACDDEVKRLAERLWGNGDGKAAGEVSFGKGKMFSGLAAEKVLAEAGIPADFACDRALAGKLRYTHRRLEDGGDVYFVANRCNAPAAGVCAFRVAGKQPQFWRPESGRIEPVAAFEREGQTTRIPLRLEAAESVFVVFRPGQSPLDPVVALACDGRALPEQPAAAKIVVLKAGYGPPGDAARTRDVKAKLEKLLDAGGASFQVVQMAEGDDPAKGVVKTLVADVLVNGKPRHIIAPDPETIDLDDPDASPPAAEFMSDSNGRPALEAWRNGRYELKTASGRAPTFDVRDIPAAQEIAGRWQLRFPPGLGAPPQVVLDKLCSWSEHPDAGVRYFSGTAEYAKTFQIPAELLAADRGLYLDLGAVAVIAEVRLNGRSLGVLWKPPYRVEIAAAARPGKNELEVRVTNLWVNRMIGDEQLPDDCDRYPAGNLKAWPKWLEQGKPSPTGRIAFSSWKLWKKDSPLQESGLLGPVRLQATKRIAMP